MYLLLLMEFFISNILNRIDKVNDEINNQLDSKKIKEIFTNY